MLVRGLRLVPERGHDAAHLPRSTPVGALSNQQVRAYQGLLEETPATVTLSRIVTDLGAHVARCPGDGLTRFLHGCRGVHWRAAPKTGIDRPPRLE